MARLLLTALILALVVTLVSFALRSVTRAVAETRDRLRLAPLGESPMQRLSFVLLVALVFYAAIWGAS